MIRRHYALLCALLLAAHLCGCRTAHPVDERPNAGLVPVAVRLDTSSVGISPFALGLPPQSADSQQNSKARIPRFAPALLPRLTDAIGLSTPEGRARRQARKDVAATVPRSVKVKNGALAWGTYAKATNAGKKANQATDSATQQIATNAVAGKGNTATQTATTQQAPSIGATIAKAITGPLGWVLGIAAAGAIGYLLYLIYMYIPKKEDRNSV